MPEYRFHLGCTRCGRTASKEYNETEQRIEEILKIAQMALRLPQYLICPQCLGILSVKPRVEKIT